MCLGRVRKKEDDLVLLKKKKEVWLGSFEIYKERVAYAKSFVLKFHILFLKLLRSLKKGLYSIWYLDPISEIPGSLQSSFNTVVSLSSSCSSFFHEIIMLFGGDWSRSVSFGVPLSVPVVPVVKPVTLKLSKTRQSFSPCDCFFLSNIESYFFGLKSKKWSPCCRFHPSIVCGL